MEDLPPDVFLEFLFKNMQILSCAVSNMVAVLLLVSTIPMIFL